MVGHIPGQNGWVTGHANTDMMLLMEASPLHLCSVEMMLMMLMVILLMLTILLMLMIMILKMQLI